MANVLVYGHGGRGKGTTKTGTYVVPEGVEICFFVVDGELLDGQPADVMAYWLMTGREANIQKWIVSTKKSYETVPNYVCKGDNNLVYKSGVYKVGVKHDKGLLMAIPGKTSKRLSDIVGGIGSKKGKIGNRVYWLCCREVLTGANNTSHVIKGKKDVGLGTDIAWTGSVSISDVGLKPSQVKKTGTWAGKTKL